MYPNLSSTSSKPKDFIAKDDDLGSLDRISVGQQRIYPAFSSETTSAFVFPLPGTMETKKSTPNSTLYPTLSAIPIPTNYIPIVTKPNSAIPFSSNYDPVINKPSYPTLSPMKIPLNYTPPTSTLYEPTGDIEKNKVNSNLYESWAVEVSPNSNSDIMVSLPPPPSYIDITPPTYKEEVEGGEEEVEERLRNSTNIRFAGNVENEMAKVNRDVKTQLDRLDSTEDRINLALQGKTEKQIQLRAERARQLEEKNLIRAREKEERKKEMDRRKLERKGIFVDDEAEES